jgi:hypothetical protein
VRCVLGLVRNLDVIPRARFIQAFEEDAGLADVLAGQVPADATLAHDLLVCLAGRGGLLAILGLGERFARDFDFEGRGVGLREMLRHVDHVGADGAAGGTAAAAFFFLGEGDGGRACAAAVFVTAGYEPCHVFAAADDVQYSAGPHALEVLDQGARAAAEGFGRIDAFCAEVVKVLVVGVEDDFLFVGVFEGLAALDVCS